MNCPTYGFEERAGIAGATRLKSTITFENRSLDHEASCCVGIAVDTVRIDCRQRNPRIRQFEGSTDGELLVRPSRSVTVNFDSCLTVRYEDGRRFDSVTSCLNFLGDVDEAYAISCARLRRRDPSI